MLYQKPRDIKYTTMAIYIDQYLSEKEVPDDVQSVIFEYLYHLVLMLARKGRFFRKSEYYDDFAATVATDVYFRLFSPKRFEYDEKGNPKLPPIKSSLNYLKSIVNFRRIDFEQSNYAQTISQDDEDGQELTQYSFADQLSDSVNDLNVVEFTCCVQNIDAAIREYLKKIPYKQNSAQWQNIYISCLLTFLNSITLSRQDYIRLKCAHTPTYLSEMYDKLLQEESKKPTALMYHLDENMQDYIVLLVREIKHFIAQELSTITDYNVSHRDMSFIALSDINSNQVEYDYYGGSMQGDYS